MNTRIRTLFLAGALLLAASLSVTVSVGAEQHEHGAAATSQAAASAPKASVPMKPHVGPLPALPRVSYAPPRPMPVVQQVYEFAARHPEVLQYVPCYCGCERAGHNGNHDCFVKSRTANGAVSEWDAHGMGCTICIDVARDAMTLFNSGSSVTQIRTLIDQKYGSHFPSSTPTPQPPKQGTRK
jgi:Protein of unknown function with PCYCGC motif